MRIQLLLVVIILAFLNGCAAISSIDGSASMRVEVEIYKGPLSLDKNAQIAELMGYVEEGYQILNLLEEDNEITQCLFGCIGGDQCNRSEWNPPGLLESRNEPQILQETTWLLNSNWRKEGHENEPLFISSKSEMKLPPANPTKDLRHQVCYIFKIMKHDISSLREYMSTIAKYTETKETQSADKMKAALELNGMDRKALLAKVKRLSTRFQRKANNWAQYHASVHPKSKRARIVMANFAAFLNEYGNQMGARADTALKLSDSTNDLDRDIQPLADMLRDSETTDYIKLYDWNDATVDTVLSPADRVRMVERLVKNANWANINTVYASGQGNVSMALIKDDIGNWNLKSFDNDPTELLQAYKKAGIAAINAVSDLANRTNLSEMAKNFAYADQIALGQGGEIPGVFNIRGLEEEIISQLENLIERETTRRKSLEGKLNEADVDVQNLEANLTMAKYDFQKKEDELINIEKEIIIRKEELHKTLGILEYKKGTGDDIQVEEEIVSRLTDRVTELETDRDELAPEVIKARATEEGARSEFQSSVKLRDEIQLELDGLTMKTHIAAREILSVHTGFLNRIAQSIGEAELN